MARISGVMPIQWYGLATGSPFLTATQRAVWCFSPGSMRLSNDSLGSGMMLTTASPQAAGREHCTYSPGPAAPQTARARPFRGASPCPPRPPGLPVWPVSAAARTSRSSWLPRRVTPAPPQDPAPVPVILVRRLVPFQAVIAGRVGHVLEQLVDPQRVLQHQREQPHLPGAVPPVVRMDAPQVLVTVHWISDQ